MYKMNYDSVLFSISFFPLSVIFHISLHFSGRQTSPLQVAILLVLYHNCNFSSSREGN
jgi:hypothetical protein